MLGGHDARAGHPPHVGGAQQHGRGGIGLGKREVELRPPLDAHPSQIRGVGDHRAPMLVSTLNRRGPHSKNAGTFS